MGLTNISYKAEYALLRREDFVVISYDLDLTLTYTLLQLEPNLTLKLYRTGHITASKAKNVCCVMSYESNKSLIKYVCYPLDNKFKTMVKTMKILEKPHIFYKMKNYNINFSLYISGFFN